LPHRGAVQALAARDRRQRGAQPPPVRRPARAPRAARSRGGSLGGRGPVPRGDAGRVGAAPAIARRGRGVARRRPARDQLPVLPRAVRGGDGCGTRHRSRDREVAALPRPGAAADPARGGGGVSSADLELQLRALAADIEFPPAPDLAAGVRAGLAQPRRARRRWIVLGPGVLVVALAGVLAVPSARTAIERWLGIGGVRFEFVDRLPLRTVAGAPDLGTTMSLRDAQARAPFRIVVPPRDLGRYA